MALPLAPITNLNGSAIGVLNNNSEKLENEFSRLLYRDGSTNMDGSLDMDSNRIINLPYAVSPSSPVTLEQFQLEKKGDKGDRGLPGVGGNTFLSLATLKAADPLAYQTAILADGSSPALTYAYVAGDFTGKADNRYVVQIDGVPLTTGAYVRSSAVVDVKEFGAKGNGIADDTAAIQAAIDFVASQTVGGVVTFPSGVYRVTYQFDGAIPGVYCLLLKPNVVLYGLSRTGSIIRLGNGQIGPGTYGRVIITPASAENVGILNITVDGNRDNQGLFREQGNGGNIVINPSKRIVIENVVSINANGQGIQVIGTPTVPIDTLFITNCEVRDLSGSTVNADGTIALEYNGNGCGIQVSYASNYLISNNIIDSTKDNGIDLYNENSSTTEPVGGTGIVSNNILTRTRVGIFPETSARVRVTNNYINSCRDCGVAVNRINSAPKLLEVAGNTISGTPFGIRMFGDAAADPGVVIRDNFISNITTAAGAGILLSRTSYILVEGNTFGDMGDAPLIWLSDSQVAFIRITGNRFFGNPAVGALVYNTALSTFKVKADDWLSIDGSSDTRSDNWFERHNLRATGNIDASGLPVFSSNADAIAAAHPVGWLYRTADGAIRVRV